MKGVLIVLFACVFFLKQTPFGAGWRRVARSVIATELGAEPRCFSPAPSHSPSAFFLLCRSSCSPFLELGLDQAPD